MPHLPSRSEEYWSIVSNSLRGLVTKNFFPNGFPSESDFEVWIQSETNTKARALAVRAIVVHDRTGALPFLAWMERAHPDWTDARARAYHNIAATSPYWATNRPPRWTREETESFARFFRDRFKTETNWQCRAGIDAFFLQMQPGWKGSDERLRFLEDWLGMCRAENGSNSVLRMIEDRLVPINKDAYYRRQVQW